MFKTIDRVRLIVYVYSLKQLPNFKRYGEVKYASQKMHYVVLFVNQNRVKQITNRLMHLKTVKKIFDSPLFDLSQSLIGQTFRELQDGDR